MYYFFSLLTYTLQEKIGRIIFKTINKKLHELVIILKLNKLSITVTISLARSTPQPSPEVHHAPLRYLL